jgi:hypothetical protein
VIVYPAGVKEVIVGLITPPAPPPPEPTFIVENPPAPPPATIRVSTLGIVVFTENVPELVNV